ncbi:HlyD family secretion protein [Verrucomicrobiota bacterium]
MPEEEFERPRLPRTPRQFKRAVLDYWPFLVWLLLVVFAWLLYISTSRLGGMMGTVDPVAESVAPIETARLASIEVVLGQRVKTGDVLVHMDTSLLDAETAFAEAEAEDQMALYRPDLLQFVMRSQGTLRDAEEALQSARIVQRADTARLSALREELARLEALRDGMFVSEQEISALRPEIAALAETVAGAPELIRTQEQRLRETQKIMSEMAGWMKGADIGDASQAMARQADNRRQILETMRQRNELRKKSYLLSATQDGVVSRVFHEPGEVIAGGEPVLRLVSERSTRVWGFLPEIHVHRISVGQEAVLWRQSGKGGRYRAVVVSIAPEVQDLPGRVTPLQGRNPRGRRVLLKVTETHDLLPGEIVRITIAETGWSTFWEIVMDFFSS